MNFQIKPSGSLWLTAFRPFFLLGSLYSVILISLWVLILTGRIPSSFRTSSIDWHAYEMVFGFLRAIVIGFLFTAGQNWTGKILLRGNSLFALGLLWFLGRFSFLENSLLASAAFGFDMMSDFFVIYYLGNAMYTKGQERNQIIVNAYVLLSLFHLAAGFANFEVIPNALAIHAVHLSIFVLLLFIIIIAGRILPFFTSAQIPGSRISNNNFVEKYLLPLTFVFIGSELLTYWLPIFSQVSALLALTLFLLNTLRLYLWETWKSVAYPILFILHISYLWMCLGFLAFAIYRLGYLPASPIYHIFTIGALSSFIYGMITRVPLGHTGRKIIASIGTKTAYLLLNLGFLARVIFPFIHLTKEAYIVSGILWILSFLIYLIQFTHILIQPRIDGKIG